MLKKGMLYTAVGQYSNVLIQLIMNMILSRLIPVEEFGIVATVQVFLVFFQTVVTSGFGPAIIQNKELSKKDYGSLFNFMTVFSLALAILFGLSGQVVAKIYGNIIYVRLFWLMAIIVFTEGMKVVTTAVLNKDLQFKTINLILLISNVLGALIGIITAYRGLGIYSLILSTAVPSFLTMVLNLFFAKIHFTLRWDVKPVKMVWFFARNQLAFTVLNYFSRNTDNLLVGKFLGPSSLANYQKGYQLITMPNTVFLGVISPVMQPIFSKYQDNVAVIRNSFLKIFHALAMIAFPVTIFMSVNAREIILFLFGNNWNNAVVPFQILSLSIWAQMLTSATGSIFMARNRSQTLLFNGIISTIIIVSMTILGIASGKVEFVALCVCLAYVLNFFTSYYILMSRVLYGQVSQLLKELVTPLILAVVLLITQLLCRPFLNFQNFFLTLLSRGIFWLIILSLFLIVTGEGKKIRLALEDPSNE